MCACAGHACCMCRPVSQFHCAPHQLITLSNQCWRSIIYYSLAHAHCMTVLIIAAHLLEYCFRTTSTKRKQSSRMRVTRPSSRAGAHVAAARPNIAQWATCRWACMIGWLALMHCEDWTMDVGRYLERGRCFSFSFLCYVRKWHSGQWINWLHAIEMIEMYLLFSPLSALIWSIYVVLSAVFWRHHCLYV